MINIAMIGVAHPHADRWARAWKMHTGANLIGVWDKDFVRAKQWATMFGVRQYQTLQELLDDTCVDAVGICSENSRHADDTIAAANAGKHILCEKPTALCLEDCDRMIQSVGKKKVRFMQAFPMRVDPVNEKIKALLEDGIIGEVVTFRKRHGIGWAATGKIPESYQWFTEESAGGGAFLDEGIHAADFLIWMFGQPISVTAKITGSGKRLPVDDNGIAIIEFPNHVIGTMQSSWLFQAATVTTEIFGLEGSIIHQGNDCASTAINGENNFPLQVYSRKDKETIGWQHPRMPINFMQIHETVASRFVDCLIFEKPFPSTLQNGRDALRLILGAYQSAKENRTVYFQEENTWQKQ